MESVALSPSHREVAGVLRVSQPRRPAFDANANLMIANCASNSNRSPLFWRCGWKGGDWLSRLLLIRTVEQLLAVAGGKRVVEATARRRIGSQGTDFIAGYVGKLVDPIGHVGAA